MEAFTIYIAFLSIIHLAKKAQITSLSIKKSKTLNKYLNYIDIFLEKKAGGLPKITNLNQHAIKL